MIETVVLDNGTRVFLDKISSSRILSIGFWILKGSRDEPSEMRGFSHFIEHMLFKGTEEFSSRDIAVKFDRVGADINAFTSAESLCVHCTLPAEESDFAIETMTSMFFSSKFRKEDFNVEKEVIINEISSVEDDPEEMASEDFLKNLWPGKPISEPVEGCKETIDDITREQLYDYYKKLINPEDLIVSIAGNYQDNVLKKLNKSLPKRGDRTSSVEYQKDLHVFNHPGFYKTKGEFQQIQYHNGLSFPLDHKVETMLGISLISVAFGEAMSSRLFQKVREKKGLCYNIYSFFNEYRDRNLFGIYAACSKKNIEPLINAINHEIDILCIDGFKASEIQDAKSHIKGQMMIDSEDITSRMKRMVHYYQYYNHVPDPDVILDTITRFKGINNIKNDLFNKKWTNTLWGNIGE